MERVNNELEYSPKKKPTKLHRSRLKRFGMEQCVCLIIIIVFVAAGYLATIFLASEPAINDPVENNDIDELNIPISNVETFPLAPAEGRQRRKQVYNFLLLGKDVGGGNTDTIIVANYDIPNQKVGMISIPRDTAVERTWQNNPKINSAFYGAGVDVLKDEIFHTFGIPIDYYVLVDLKGFVALVDELDAIMRFFISFLLVFLDWWGKEKAHRFGVLSRFVVLALQRQYAVARVLENAVVVVIPSVDVVAAVRAAVNKVV